MLIMHGVRNTYLPQFASCILGLGLFKPRIKNNEKRQPSVPLEYQTGINRIAARILIAGKLFRTTQDQLFT